MSSKVKDAAVEKASESTAEPVKAGPKPGELKDLFAKYEKANKAVLDADAAYLAAMVARSKVVEQFASFGAAFTAPNGDRLTITSRTNKETGAKSFYFKGPGKAEALRIE